MASSSIVIHEDVSHSGWALLPNVAYQGRPVYHNARMRQVAQEVDHCYLLAVSPEFEASLLLLIESGHLEVAEAHDTESPTCRLLEQNATARAMLAELQEWCLGTVGYVPRQFRQQWTHRIAKVLGDEVCAR